MSVASFDEVRRDREEGTKRAVAEIIRARIYSRRMQQTVVSRLSGVSRSHIRSLLRAEKQMSLFIFLELSKAMRFEDPCEFLRDILDRREELMASHIRDESPKV